MLILQNIVNYATSKTPFILMKQYASFYERRFFTTFTILTDLKHGFADWICESIEFFSNVVIVLVLEKKQLQRDKKEK